MSRGLGGDPHVNTQGGETTIINTDMFVCESTHLRIHK